ncbi:MAG: hypothetical protein JW866_00240, partial [Ignavibacteriales bacterium]|nr:hypothetical protein [Ignavibacteriales bacterium]
MKIDILNLEWSSAPSRDRQMATLVCNYLRYMRYEVLEDIMFLGCNLINKYKPHLYFNVGPIGAKTNFKVMKYARGRNIVAVSLVAEGNFRTDKKTIGQFVWGWNKKKVLYENLNMQWSERTRNSTYEYFPQLKGKIKVSGAVGFDVYKISKNKLQKEFLEKYNKNNYKKVIGVGCWDFGAFHPEDRRHKTVMK